ncbi:DUF4386 family protein [bacterium]|nr:DUF4386 family protein [bacterium]
MGAIAALCMAAVYLIAMVGYLLVLGTLGDFDAVQKVALLVDNQSFLYILNLIAYVIAGLVMVVLALALYERLKAGSPAMMQIATIIGLIWATVLIASGLIRNFGMGSVVDLYSTDPSQAGMVWLAIESVFEGLSCATGEILGGPWVLLVSWAALRGGELPKALNYLGVVLGVAGILSIIPALFLMLAIVFGMGKIVWLIWLGIVMLRSSQSAEVSIT